MTKMTSYFSKLFSYCPLVAGGEEKWFLKLLGHLGHLKNVAVRLQPGKSSDTEEWSGTPRGYGFKNLVRLSQSASGELTDAMKSSKTSRYLTFFNRHVSISADA